MCQTGSSKQAWKFPTLLSQLNPPFHCREEPPSASSAKAFVIKFSSCILESLQRDEPGFTKTYTKEELESLQKS